MGLIFLNVRMAQTLRAIIKLSLFCGCRTVRSNPLLSQPVRERILKTFNWWAGVGLWDE